MSNATDERTAENPVSIDADCYAIRPLEWEKRAEEYYEVFTAQTTFGELRVQRFRENTTGRWCEWTWGYCFDEYHDEQRSLCLNAVEGKQMAEAYWKNRLETALVRVA